MLEAIFSIVGAGGAALAVLALLGAVLFQLDEDCIVLVGVGGVIAAMGLGGAAIIRWLAG